MRRITYSIGYFSAWLFDSRGMPLGMSYGEVLTVGGAAIFVLCLLRLL